MDNQELNAKLADLTRLYTQRLGRELGERLVSVALFGSVARGTAHNRSDIDLFVVIRDLPTGAFARREVVEPVHQALLPELDKLLQAGIYTDLIEVLRTPDEAGRFHMLYLDMMLEAQLLYDRDDFMKERLAQVRRKAQALGSTRRQIGDVYYWDLKPDFVPGDLIAL
jgi:predicted nucleotidyltransferase